MNSYFNDLKFPWTLFLIWILVYIFIGPGIPYTNPYHNSNPILMVGTISGAFLLTFSLFFSFRATILKRSWKGIVTTSVIFFTFVATIIASMYLVTLWFQTVAYMGDTYAMDKSKLLTHSNSAWKDKDCEKGEFLARWVFRDYGFRIAYHNKNGDVIIFEPDNQDFESKDEKMEIALSAEKKLPTLLKQAKKHQTHIYIYLAAFFCTMGFIFIWSFKILPKIITDNIKINGTR